jgi:hypothetical protein
MNFTHEDYLNEDWFDGEESDISCRTQKIVKVRKEHECWLSLCPGNTPHKIAIGTEAYYEKALIDRSFWGKFYMCKDCMDKQLTEYYGEDEE